jgi:hypothetical protein
LKVNDDPMKIFQGHLALPAAFLPLLAGFAATAGWLTPRQTFAEARGIVSLIKDNAAKATITTHKL